MRVVADAANADELTARRIVPTAVDGIGEHIRVGMAAHVQQRDIDLAVHQFHESSSLAAQLAAHRPTLIFQSRVRRTWNLYCFTQVRDCLGEILRRSPFLRRAASHQSVQGLSVVSGESMLRPQRNLIAQQAGQQGAALAVAAEDRSPQSHRVRRTDQRDSANHPGMQHRGGPADQPAIGMTDQGGRYMTQRADQAGGVPGQRPAVVATGWLIAAAIPA